MRRMDLTAYLKIILKYIAQQVLEDELQPQAALSQGNILYEMPY